MRSEAKLFARFVADTCVRNNTSIESLHAGKMLPKKYQSEEYSRITDREMRLLMLEIEKNLYKTFRALSIELEEGFKDWFFKEKGKTKHDFLKIIERNFFGKTGVSWDIPKKEWNRLLNLHKKND